MVDQLTDMLGKDANKSLPGLLLAVFIKFGLAPIVCVAQTYAIMVLYQDNKVLAQTQLVQNKEQTIAQVQMTNAVSNLTEVIKPLSDAVRRLENQKH